MAYGLQLTVYTEASNGPRAQLARRIYSLLRRNFMTAGGLEGDAHCLVKYEPSVVIIAGDIGHICKQRMARINDFAGLQ